MVTTKQSALSGAIYIAAGCVAWSFAGVLGKWTPWGALSIIGVRALLATVAFGLLRGHWRVRPCRGTWLGALGVALTSLLFIVSNKLTTAANAIVLQYAMPAVVIVASAVVYKQRPSRLDTLATVMTMLGVALCFVSGLKAGNLLGDALALLSAATYALVFMAARTGANPMDYSYLGNMISCLCLLALPFDRNASLAWQPLLGVLLMGVCLTAGYYLFSRGMQAGVSPITAAIVANIEPVLNPIWVFLALGEAPGLFTLLGATLVLFTVTAYSVINARRIEQTAASA